MRYVCPKDVTKMLLQQARTVYRKKCAANHEYEELKEGIWLEPALASTRSKIGLKSIGMLRGRYFWKEAECRKDSSTLVGQMKVSAKHATRRKAQKSTGSTTAQDCTRSEGRSQKPTENKNK